MLRVSLSIIGIYFSWLATSSAYAITNSCFDYVSNGDTYIAVQSSYSAQESGWGADFGIYLGITSPTSVGYYKYYNLSAFGSTETHSKEVTSSGFWEFGGTGAVGVLFDEYFEVNLSGQPCSEQYNFGPPTTANVTISPDDTVYTGVEVTIAWASDADDCVYNGDSIGPFGDEQFIATAQDAGTYEIQCSNSFGSIPASATLTVVDPPAVSLEYAMFIPLDHVRLPNPVSTNNLYSGDNTTVYNGEYRINQSITLNLADKQATQIGALSGVTERWDQTAHLSSSLSCTRKNDVISYGMGGGNVTYTGSCIDHTNTPVDEGIAANMGSIVSSVVDSTASSITVSFEGSPYNAITGFPLLENLGSIDWDNTITISWEDNQLEFELDMDHDGFPSHHVSIGDATKYSWDPISNNYTPLALGPGREIQDSVSGNL